MELKEIIWKWRNLTFYLTFLTGIYLIKFNNKNRKTLCWICSRKVPGQEKYQVKCVKLSLLSWLLSLTFLWIYHFHCSSIFFLLLHLSFDLDSLHYHPDSQHFLHFYSYSPHFPYSILQFHILAFTDSVLSLYSLRICLRKIVALNQKRTLSFFITA